MRSLFLGFFCLTFVAVGSVRAESEAEKAERFKVCLERAESWAMKAILVLSLAEVEHPDAVAPIGEIFADRDGRLRIYALECLSSMPAPVLRSGASSDLVNRLVRDLGRKQPYYHTRVLETLRAIAGDDLPDRRAAQGWWREHRRTYAPAPWVERPGEAAPPAGGDGGGSAVGRLIEKLFDLSENGLEIVFVLDATGSMQPTIDGVRDSIDNLAVLIGSIVPRFRMGVVVYRDLEDMSDGAKILAPLSTNYRAVKEKLDKETASGGGDFPERVEKGLELTLGPKNELGWTARAGKVVVVIGDAPPHDDQLERCKELAREAHQKPFGIPGGIVTTGPRGKRIPRFIVSAITVGAMPPTRAAFDAIAEAGGGSSTVHNGASGANGLMKQICILAFGAEWEDSIGTFVDFFMKFRDEGLFR